MSVINQMLKDLEQRQQGGEGAVYVPPVRQQGWWMLVLTLICGLALGIQLGRCGQQRTGFIHFGGAGFTDLMQLHVLLS